MRSSRLAGSLTTLLTVALLLCGCSNEPRPEQAELPTLPVGEKWCGLFSEEEVAALHPGGPESRRQEVTQRADRFECVVWGEVDQPRNDAPLVLSAVTGTYPARETMDSDRATNVLASLKPDGCFERVPDDEYERWACDHGSVVTYVTCLVPAQEDPGSLEERYYFAAIEAFEAEDASTAELVELSETLDIFALNFHGCEERLPPEGPQ